MKWLALLIFFGNSFSYLLSCQCQFFPQNEQETNCCMQTQKSSCCASNQDETSGDPHFKSKKKCTKHDQPSLGKAAVLLFEKKTDGPKLIYPSPFFVNKSSQSLFLIERSSFNDYPKPFTHLAPDIYRLSRLIC